MIDAEKAEFDRNTLDQYQGVLSNMIAQRDVAATLLLHRQVMEAGQDDKLDSVPTSQLIWFTNDRVITIMQLELSAGSYEDREAVAELIGECLSKLSERAERVTPGHDQAREEIASFVDSMGTNLLMRPPLTIGEDLTYGNSIPAPMVTPDEQAALG